jgi:hypothetical protein
LNYLIGNRLENRPEKRLENNINKLF